MGKVPKPRGEFLRPYDVQDGDQVEVTGGVETISAEDSRYGRERLIVPIMLPDGDAKRWPVNLTTHRVLYAAWGDNDQDWIGKKIRVNKTRAVIRGEQREVLYGEPATNPQQTLTPNAATLKQQLQNMTPEQREALLKDL